MEIAKIIFAIAAVCMISCLFLVLKLRKQFTGGVIGKRINILTVLVILFTFGYIAVPFLSDIPTDVLLAVVAGVFLFGAIYVFITILLINSIVDTTSIVYLRTKKGNAVLRDREYKLSKISRSVLILVNGFDSGNSIASKTPTNWETHRCLLVLEKQGMIKDINSKSLGLTKVSNLQKELISCVNKYLPENNINFVNRIIHSENTHQALSKVIDNGSFMIRLTISEKVGFNLKNRLYNILNDNLSNTED